MCFLLTAATFLLMWLINQVIWFNAASIGGISKQVIFDSSLLQAVFLFLIRQRPLVAALINTAAKEDVRRSSIE